MAKAILKAVDDITPAGFTTARVGMVPVKDAERMGIHIPAWKKEILQDAPKAVKEFSETDKGVGTTAHISRRQKIPTKLHDILVAGGRKTEAEIRKNLKTVEQYRDSLKGNDRTDFWSLYLAGNKRNQWLTDEQLSRLDVTEPVRDTYKAFRLDSDKKYFIDNEAAREIMSSKGYKFDEGTGSIVKEVNSRELSSKEFQKFVIKDPNGEMITYKNFSVDDIKAKYLDNGEYKLVQLHPNEIKHGSNHTHRLIHSSNALQELPDFVLPYTGGGSRAYTNGTHFVKVGRTFYNDGGTAYLGYAKTLVAGNNIKKLNKYASDVNKVVDIYNKYSEDMVAMQRALDSADLTEFKVNTVEELKSLIRTAENPDGLLDANPKITNAKVYRGDEKFVYDIDKNSQDFMQLDDLEDYDMELSELMGIRGKYYRSRGDEMLDNINTKSYGHVVDPFEIWQNNITTAAMEKNLNKIFRDWGEYFKKKFAPVITDDININAMSGEDVIKLATIKAPNSTYDSLAREAARSQATYKALKNIPTAIDEKIIDGLHNTIKRLPRWMWDNAAMDFMRRSKPIAWANAIVFRNYLGMFNANQLHKNGVLPILNMMALEPTISAKALRALPAVVTHYFHRDEKGLTKLIKKLFRATDGLTDAELEGFVKYMDEYGTFHQMSQRPEVSSTAYNISSKFGDADLVFLKTANNTAQLMADLVAYLKHNGDVTKVAGYADDLMGNNNRVNTSTLQRSLAGQLTMNFTTYPISVIETLTGTHFTPLQKFRFAAYQLVAWGVGGTFARDYVTHLYSFMEDHDILDDEWRGLIADGLITTVMAHNGYDVREGVDLAGVFNQLLGIVPAIAEAFGIAPDLPIGNAFSILGDCYGTIKDMFAPDTDTFDLLNWARSTAARPQAPTSVRNLSNAVIALDAQQFWNKNGDIIERDVDLKKTFMTLIGFKSVANRIRQMDYESGKIQKEAITEYFKENVKPVLQQINTYKRTGQGDKELTHNRNQDWINLYNKEKTAMRGFYAWIREFHPDYLSLAQQLISTEINAGRDSIAEFTLPELKEHQRNLQRLGVQE